MDLKTLWFSAQCPNHAPKIGNACSWEAWVAIWTLTFRRALGVMEPWNLGWARPTNHECSKPFFRWPGNCAGLLGGLYLWLRKCRRWIACWSIWIRLFNAGTWELQPLNYIATGHNCAHRVSDDILRAGAEKDVRKIREKLDSEEMGPTFVLVPKWDDVILR